MRSYIDFNDGWVFHEGFSGQLTTDAAPGKSVRLPIVVVEVTCAPEVTRILMGVEYRELGSAMMPLLAIAAMAICIIANYLCIPFHLTGQTKVIVWISVITALVNVSANLVLIPIFQVIGAAYGILLAIFTCFATYLYLSSKKGILGANLPDMAKIAVAVGVFAAFLNWDTGEMFLGQMFLVKAVLGGLLYAAAILILNPARIRTDMVEELLKLRQHRIGRRKTSVMSETQGKA